MRQIFYLCYYGKMGGVADLYNLPVHDRTMFINELYTVKAQEEKDAKQQADEVNKIK